MKINDFGDFTAGRIRTHKRGYGRIEEGYRPIVIAPLEKHVPVVGRTEWRDQEKVRDRTSQGAPTVSLSCQKR
jgi:hypothetical protein